MLKNKDKDQIVSFRLIQSADGTFKITKREVMNRTKRMVAFDRGLDWDEVTVGKNLEDDLKYLQSEKKNLKGLIENVFFRDIDAVIDSDDLERVATVRDLYTNIWNKYSWEDEIISKGVILSKSGIYKITKSETMRRTKKMIAKDKGILDLSKITVGQDLANDLRYSTKDKRGLSKKINDVWFKDVNATVDDDDLKTVTTVRNLITKIYDNYIPDGNKI